MSSRVKFGTEEDRTCMGADIGSDDIHREGRCEDCDVWRMSRLNLGQVADLYVTGRVGQDLFEAYMWLHAHMSPYRSAPPLGDIPAVRRMVRKLCRIRGFEIPAAAREVSE